MTNTATTEYSDEEYLSRAPVGRALRHLCIPMMIALTMGTIYNVVNAWFIGLSGDAILLAAITFATPIPTLMMAIGGVFGVGGSTLMTRLLGAGDREGAKRISSFTVWGALLSGVVVGIITTILVHPISDLLGADAASHDATALYTGILLAFSPVLMCAFAIEQVVRGEGASKVAMGGLIASTVTNIVMDAVLILCLHMGVAGAAISTGIANVVTVLVFAVWIARKSRVATVSIRFAKASWREIRSILAVGSSELMQSGFLLAISLVLNHEAIRYGNAVVAGFGVAARVTQIPEFLAMGVAMGAIPLLAYAHGAGDESRLAEALKKCVTWTAALVVPLVVLALIFRVQLMEMFGGGSLGQSGVTILVAMLVAAVFNALGGLFTAYFQATGRGAQAGVLSALAGVLFLPIALLAPLAVGLTGLVWAMPIAEITTAIVGGILLLITLAKARREPSLVSVEGAENPADARINEHATTEPQAVGTKPVPVAETPSA